MNLKRLKHALPVFLILVTLLCQAGAYQADAKKFIDSIDSLTGTSGAQLNNAQSFIRERAGLKSFGFRALKTGALRSYFNRRSAGRRVLSELTYAFISAIAFAGMAFILFRYFGCHYFGAPGLCGIVAYIHDQDGKK